jgi:N utilization substance protein B
MMTEETFEIFPLSKTRFVNGSRRLAREKVLQILNCIEVSDIPFEKLFTHVFFRRFNFGESVTVPDKLLTPDEIYELEADMPIQWNEDEIQFAKGLIGRINQNKEYIGALIEEFTEHWELERIAQIDRFLMFIAVTELIYFPEIPTKVSINEAIEIAKKYSTHKSGSFINGILDKILIKLKAENKITKTGRGLIEE